MTAMFGVWCSGNTTAIPRDRYCVQTPHLPIPNVKYYLLLNVVSLLKC